MNKDEKQQWDIHTLNGQVVAVKGEPRAGAEMRSLAGMCDLANALQQQITELAKQAALADWYYEEIGRESRETNRQHKFRVRYDALASPPTSAQEEQR